MNKNTEKELSVSNNGINYYIIKSPGSKNGRLYGVFAEMANDNTDFGSAENLFFTKSEATAYCKWLADNEVYPITLCEILGNIYHLQI